MRTLGSDTNVIDDLEQSKRMEVDTIDDLEPESWEDGAPKMPCVPCTRVHREKLKEKFPRFHTAMVSRPVGKKEMLSNPKAVEAIRKESSGLRKQNVFYMKVVREYDESRPLQEVVHFARVHGIRESTFRPP